MFGRLYYRVSYFSKVWIEVIEVRLPSIQTFKEGWILAPFGFGKG
jgi:hypothetical protein